MTRFTKQVYTPSDRAPKKGKKDTTPIRVQAYGDWYVIGRSKGVENIISTHLSNKEANIKAEEYRKGGLAYEEIVVEQCGCRGNAVKDRKV